MEEKKKKPLHKRWWFWVLIIVAVILIFPIIVEIIGASSSSSSSSPKPKLSKNAKIVKNNWKNKKIDFSDGTFKVYNMSRIKLYTENEDGFRKFRGGGILYKGYFTNKTDKPLSVEKFWNRHVEVRAYDLNGYWSLEPVIYLIKNIDGRETFKRPVDDVIVEPKQTIKVGIDNVGDEGKTVPDEVKIKFSNHGKKIWLSDYEKYKNGTLTFDSGF